MHVYLAQHPQLTPANVKEVGFFSPGMTGTWPDHPNFAELESIAADSSARAGREWYAAQFPVPRPWRSQMFYEATPEYLYFPEAAERTRAFRPDIKLIIVLRDPVDRAYSSWNMQRGFDNPGYRSLKEERSFEQAIDDELSGREGPEPAVAARYLERGLYEQQLRRYYRLFPGRQILVLDSAELRTEPAVVLDRICRFLGVAEFPKDTDLPPVHTGNYLAPISADLREILATYFAPTIPACSPSSIETSTGRDHHAMSREWQLASRAAKSRAPSQPHTAPGARPSRQARCALRTSRARPPSKPWIGALSGYEDGQTLLFEARPAARRPRD